jgi:TonB-linked SusC/RagA family outer membrane protein
MRHVRSKAGIAGVVAGLLLLCGSTAARAQGTVSGRITDAGTGQPVQEARVFVVGTNLYATSNTEGRYTVRNVPAGNAEVRVLRVGYTEQKRPVTVNATQPTTLDFALAAAVVKLQEVVTTATGETRRVELGNSIAQVNAAEIQQTTAVRNIGDLLTARAPGVQVLPATITGGSARIRIRGTSSLSLSSDPIYVIDGVRMTSDNGSAALNLGGTTPSRVGDINPEDIENIEVVKGPSAATLYGTDAANGVIVITTKRGRAGAPKFGFHVAQGLVKDRAPYPLNYSLWGHTATDPKSTPNCILTQLASGACIKDSVTAFSPLLDPDVTPMTTGNRRQIGMDLSGGSEATRYFLSGEGEAENGVYKMPDADIRRLDAANIGTRAEQLNPNRLEKYSLRANLNSALSPKLDIGLNTSYNKLDQRAPQIDNNINGLYFSLLGGPGYKTPEGDALGGGNGYGNFKPGEIFEYATTQAVNRFLGSVNANWRPTSWLSNRGNVGVDYTGRLETQICRRSNCPNFGSNRQGFAVNSRGNIRTFSFDLGSTATFDPRSDVNSKTTVGAQYNNYYFDRNVARGTTLPPGTQTVSAGAVPFASSAATYQKTLGVFVEEALAFRDRLFLTGAVRTDQNSAFGTNFQHVIYPKASLSYIISDESFFPHVPALNQLRIRSAYGAAGTQPGPNDAPQFFVPTTTNIAGADQGGVLYSYIGNPDLKPERATEFEGGFDAKMFNSRVNVELTYYSKLTKDALIQTVVPPTAGTTPAPGVQDVLLKNLGSVKNAGVEGLINAQIIDTRRFGWDFTFSGSSNANKLVSLGDVPPQIAALSQQRAGYPLNGYWSRQITSYADANGDNIISCPNGVGKAGCEFTATDTAVFLGLSAPKYELVFGNGFDLLSKTLRINALFDAKGGHKLYDNTNRIRCVSLGNCQELVDPSAPLERQAAVVAVRTASTIQDGYIEDARFIRFRELSLTYNLTQNMAARYLRADRASITFSARNLSRWTRYKGVDPESNYNTGGPVASFDLPQDLVTPPPPSLYQIRLNLGF